MAVRATQASGRVLDDFKPSPSSGKQADFEVRTSVYSGAPPHSLGHSQVIRRCFAGMGLQCTA
eukprot:4343996-Alexandrium_andersonii.AAC.1